MNSPRELLSRLAGSLRRRSVEPELDEEIRFHLDMEAARNVRLGMAPGAARRAALLRFGGPEQIKEAVRDEYRSRPLEDFVHDLRYGIRSAFRVPLFSLLGLAGAIEIIGGLLILVGLFTRVTAFVCSGEMAFAYFIGHAHRALFPLQNMGELPILYCFIFLYLAAAGAGPWSVDAVRHGRR